MKAITMGVLLFISVGFSTSMVWSASSGNGLDELKVSQSVHTWSVTDHVSKAKAAKNQFKGLEGKIEKLQARIDKFNKKPHLDTKGFKRQGLRLWKGKLVNELRETADKIAWHETQAKEMLALQDKNTTDS